MVSPARRRRAVEHLKKDFGVSERRACRVAGQPRATQRYRPQARDDERVLVRRMRALERRHSAWGYRRIWAGLWAEGFAVSAQRIWRLRKSTAVAPAAQPVPARARASPRRRLRAARSATTTRRRVGVRHAVAARREAD